ALQVRPPSFRTCLLMRRSTPSVCLKMATMSSLTPNTTSSGHASASTSSASRMIVEHWDNLQETATEPSPSGHTMIDGPTIASDLDKTDANKALMQRYMEDLLAGRRETFPRYFNGTQYIQHNPWVADTIPGLI